MTKRMYRTRKMLGGVLSDDDVAQCTLRWVHGTVKILSAPGAPEGYPNRLYYLGYEIIRDSESGMYSCGGHQSSKLGHMVQHIRAEARSVYKEQ